LKHVSDGLEALAYVRRLGRFGSATRPDLILLDLDLPHMHGLRVLSELKGDPELRLIPIVVLCGSSSREDLTLAYELGANAYVIKPAELDHFRSTVRVICDFWCAAAQTPAWNHTVRPDSRMKR
jgi:CheY-like chemotaxis protein